MTTLPLRLTDPRGRRLILAARDGRTYAEIYTGNGIYPFGPVTDEQLRQIAAWALGLLGAAIAVPVDGVDGVDGHDRQCDAMLAAEDTPRRCLRLTHDDIVPHSNGVLRWVTGPGGQVNAAWVDTTPYRSTGLEQWLQRERSVTAALPPPAVSDSRALAESMARHPAVTAQRDTGPPPESGDGRDNADPHLT